MTNQPEKIIVCSPVKDGTPYVESEVRQCFRCEQDVWLSESGKSQAPGDDTKTICIECVKDMEGHSYGLPTQAVFEDCAKHLGRPVEEIKRELTQLMDRLNSGENLDIESNEVIRFMRAAMAMQQEGGLPEGFVQVTDPRSRDENGKLPVDIVFANPGTSMPFFEAPPYMTVEDLINDFDRPEELEAMQMGGEGPLYVVRKSHSAWIKQREAAVQRVLERHGLQVENIGDIPTERIMSLRSEIQKEIAEMN